MIPLSIDNFPFMILDSVSKFRFKYPSANTPSDSGEEDNATARPIKQDSDGDLVVERKRTGFIEIEHSKSTRLNLVGLQVWRGALLLADYILHNNKKFRNKGILELGSGVGLSSIVSAMYAKKVVCTDIDIGGLLNLIKTNVLKNNHLCQSKDNVEVMELDFLNLKYSDKLNDALKEIDFVIAADVIYDDDITEGFVNTIEKLLSEFKRIKAVYVALEKRYVFTTDICAPMYEQFLKLFDNMNCRMGPCRFQMENINLTFPQYFEYEKVKDLVLLKISRL
jgi:predicted nicotinamide N-methyase